MWLVSFAITLASTIAASNSFLGQAEQQITALDRGLAELMLSDVYKTLKQNYYDASFHGINIEERYKNYVEQLKNAKSNQAAYRVIEAYLSGLDDSHTIFIPPPNSNRVIYGFRLKIIGDQCFITDLRPDTDAAQKLRHGDQVVTLDGYTLNRQDLWQLEYYLYRLPPRLTSDFTLRDVYGSVRQETVTANLQEKHAFKDLDFGLGLGRLEMEERRQMLRSRSAEQDDVFFWKFASFEEGEGSISHMLAQARMHKALVLDLRGNSGGLESNLVFLLGNFFGHDVRIGRKIMRKEQRDFVAKSAGHGVFAGQLIVLVDSRSASAAELFARIVQLEHRGSVVGDRSAGRVMAAQFFPLKVGTNVVTPYGVEITVADLVMSDGKSLEKLGVTPDINLLPSAADLAAGRDPVLARAAELAGAKMDAAEAGKMFPYEWPPMHLTSR
jgi:C-terminal processing protease CtpA/Prc